MRDSQRSKLYRSEREIFVAGSAFGGDTLSGVQEINSFLASLQQKKRVQKAFPRVECRTLPRLEIKRGQGSATAFSWSNDLVFRPLDGKTVQKWLVVHEIAHCWDSLYAPSKGWSFDQIGGAHGRRFAAAYLELVKIVFGVGVAKELAASFRKHGVKYKRLVRRVMTDEQRAAAGRRLAAARKVRAGGSVVDDQSPDLGS